MSGFWNIRSYMRWVIASPCASSAGTVALTRSMALSLRGAVMASPSRSERSGFKRSGFGSSRPERSGSKRATGALRLPEQLLQSGQGVPRERLDRVVRHRRGAPDRQLLPQGVDRDLGVAPAELERLERLQVLQDGPVLELEPGRQRDAALARQRLELRAERALERQHGPGQRARLGPGVARGDELRGSGLHGARAVREGEEARCVEALGRRRRA